MAQAFTSLQAPPHAPVQEEARPTEMLLAGFWEGQGTLLTLREVIHTRWEGWRQDAACKDKGAAKYRATLSKVSEQNTFQVFQVASKVSHKLPSPLKQIHGFPWGVFIHDLEVPDHSWKTCCSSWQWHCGQKPTSSAPIQVPQTRMEDILVQQQKKKKKKLHNHPKSSL